VIKSQESEEKDGIVKLKDSHGKSLNYPIEEHDTLIVRKAVRHLWRFFSKAINEVVYNVFLPSGDQESGGKRFFFICLGCCN